METTLLRIFLTPVLVLTVYFLQKKWGARAGGLFLGLPINIAPFLILIYLQENDRFLKEAIHGVFVGQIVLLIFAFVYSRCAIRFEWRLTITLVTAITLLFSLILHYLNLGLQVTLAATLFLYIAIRYSWPKNTEASIWEESFNWDLLFRLVVTSITVFLLTTFSNYLGPILSGTLSAYPIIMTFMGAMSQRRSGPPHILKTLQGLIYSLPVSYAILLFLLALL